MRLCVGHVWSHRGCSEKICTHIWIMYSTERVSLRSTSNISDGHEQLEAVAKCMSHTEDSAACQGHGLGTIIWLIITAS